MTKIKKICYKCNKKFNKTFIYKGGFYCILCYRSFFNKMPQIGQTGFSIERALSKIYLIKEKVNTGNRSPNGYLYFPKCLIGKKIKIILIDENKNKN